jgi:hypothetical protein
MFVIKRTHRCLADEGYDTRRVGARDELHGAGLDCPGVRGRRHQEPVLHTTTILHEDDDFAVDDATILAEYDFLVGSMSWIADSIFISVEIGRVPGKRCVVRRFYDRFIHDLNVGLLRMFL